MPVAQIQADNECDFGKWLYSPLLDPQEKQSEDYRTVKELHAEFHRIAGRTATLAIEGRRTEAEHMMTSGGEFADISARLASAMLTWKKSAS